MKNANRRIFQGRLFVFDNIEKLARDKVWDKLGSHVKPLISFGIQYQVVDQLLQDLRHE